MKPLAPKQSAYGAGIGMQKMTGRQMKPWITPCYTALTTDYKEKEMLRNSLASLSLRHAWTKKRPCDSYDRLEFFSWLMTSLNVPELVNWMRVFSL